jgi:hypothetical protein
MHHIRSLLSMRVDGLMVSISQQTKGDQFEPKQIILPTSLSLLDTCREKLASGRTAVAAG